MTVHNPELLWLALLLAGVLTLVLLVTIVMAVFSPDRSVSHQPARPVRPAPVMPLKVHAERVEQVEAA